MPKQTRREFLKATGSLIASAGLMSAAGPVFSADFEHSGKRPNILLLFPDQHRPDWLGTNSQIPIRTPNIDKLGARGVRFSYAFTSSPQCSPARACLASGKEYDHTGVASNGYDYPIGQWTFYEQLRDAGYYVMGCGKFDLSKRSHNWGINGKHHLKEWGFSDGINNAGKGDAFSSIKNGKAVEPYTAFLEKRGLLKEYIADGEKRRDPNAAPAFPCPLPDDAYCDNWVEGNCLKLFENVPKDKPWFMQVNFVGPHPPWDMTESMSHLYKNVQFPQPNGNKQYPPETHEEIRRNYAAMIENIDRLIGLIQAELKKRGELENTLIVFSSDHGEMLGDHNLWGKCQPYQPSAGVPMVIAGPGVKQGIVSKSPASLVDLTATFLDYAGLQKPADVDGVSLKPVLNGKKQRHKDYALSGFGDWRLVFDGRYKLIRKLDSKTGKISFDAPGVLYDLQEDPLENTNIAAKMPDVVKRLDAILVKGGVR